MKLIKTILIAALALTVNAAPIVNSGYPPGGSSANPAPKYSPDNKLNYYYGLAETIGGVRTVSMGWYNDHTVAQLMNIVTERNLTNWNYYVGRYKAEIVWIALPPGQAPGTIGPNPFTQ